MLADAQLRDELCRRLTALARQSSGSSTRLCRMILMAEPPSLDAGEATDKGSINQRAVLTRRATLVDQLYAGTAGVIVIGDLDEHAPVQHVSRARCGTK